MPLRDSALGANVPGVHETNPLDATTKKFMKDAVRHVDWRDKDLKKIVRLRLLSDPGFPFYDVSYCIGEMKDGSAVHVDLPFDQLPRRGMNAAIIKYAKQDNVFAKGLGIFDNISTLV